MNRQQNRRDVPGRPYVDRDDVAQEHINNRPPELGEYGVDRDTVHAWHIYGALMQTER